MKRLLAIGAVSVIGALSIASAAALTVNGGAVQAGQDNTLTCDTSVDIAYTLGAYAPATPPDSGFPVTGVTVSDIDGNCVGRTIDVVLTGPLGVQLATGQLPTITSASHSFATTPAVDAYDVEDVHIAIH